MDASAPNRDEDRRTAGFDAPAIGNRRRMFNRSKRPKNPFESRTEVWRQVGFGSEIDPGSAQRARGGAMAIGLLIAAVLIVLANRRTLFPGGATRSE
jgi:hypothetical protein